MFVSVIVLKRTFFFLIALFDNSAIPMWICIMSSRSNSANVCHAHLTDRIIFFLFVSILVTPTYSISFYHCSCLKAYSDISMGEKKWT